MVELVSEYVTLSPFSHFAFWFLVFLLLIFHFRNRRKIINLTERLNTLAELHVKNEKKVEEMLHSVHSMEEGITRLESTMSLIVKLILGKNEK